MTTPENTQARAFTAESTLTPVSLSPGGVHTANVGHKAVVYVDPPPLPSTKRVTYEPVSNRDLPENFDYSLPLTHRVIVGEYRDNAAHWYYIENADGIVYRVSSLLVTIKLAWSHKLLISVNNSSRPVLSWRRSHTLSLNMVRDYLQSHVCYEALFSIVAY